MIGSVLVSRRTGLAGLTAGAALWISRRARADAPRVLIVGDSMIAGGFGLYLEQELRARAGWTVVRRGKTSSGLSRPDFFDWVREGRRLRERHEPTAVVAMFGGNDGQGLWMGRKAPSPWIRWHEPGWTEEYRRRVDAFVEAVAAKSTWMFWVGMPVMKPVRLHERVRHLNTIYRAQMAIRPRAEFVDVWRVLAGPAGEYVDRLPVDGQRTKVRAGDGVHLTVAGAHLLVRHVVPPIEGALA
jgi:hypothetical protein